MRVITKIISLLRMGMIHPSLMILAWKLKRTKRTFLSYTTLSSLATSFMMERKRHAGAVQAAEFGVGRGGSAILLAWLVEKFGGKLTLYDLFGRIPAPTEIDGERAQQRYQGILTDDSPEYYGNIPDLLSLVTSELSEVCRPERIDIVAGRYEETLVAVQDTRNFNLVHIDCDWYASSMVVYEYLQPRLLRGAIIQVDDYSSWDGSRRAFKDAGWLSQYQSRIVDGVLVVDTAYGRDGQLI